jgi:hypothetical protein
MGLNEDDIRQLIAILSKGLSDEQTPKKTKTARKTKTNNTKTKKTPASKNKFEKMPEFGMCKEDLEFDKKIRKPPPSVRNRPFDFITVQCRVCGKQEKVAPSLVESIERYKCNKCATGAG